MRMPFGEKTGCRTTAVPLLTTATREARPAAMLALYSRPPCSVHVVQASVLPSGDHAGSASITLSVDTRRGVPAGQSIT